MTYIRTRGETFHLIRGTVGYVELLVDPHDALAPHGEQIVGFGRYMKLLHLSARETPNTKVLRVL